MRAPGWKSAKTSRTKRWTKPPDHLLFRNVRWCLFPSSKNKHYSVTTWCLKKSPWDPLNSETNDANSQAWTKFMSPFRSGWWFQPLWKILACWDYFSQDMEKYKMFQTTNHRFIEGLSENSLPQNLFKSHDWTANFTVYFPWFFITCSSQLSIFAEYPLVSWHCYWKWPTNSSLIYPLQMVIFQFANG